MSKTGYYNKNGSPRTDESMAHDKRAFWLRMRILAVVFVVSLAVPVWAAHAQSSDWFINYLGILFALIAVSCIVWAFCLTYVYREWEI